jgi:DNA/RNA-binding domain of Phe-tRNA-synthetase-like protein
MAAWREVYRAFGSKPSRTRNSAAALAKRALTAAGLRDDAGVTCRRWN